MTQTDVMNHKKIRQMNAERGSRNRANGEAFEFRVLRSFKNRSDVLFAIRSAGSHSLIDIIVQFKSKDRKQLWITCKKNGYTDPIESKQIWDLLNSTPYHVEVREYYYASAKKMVWRRLS